LIGTGRIVKSILASLLIDSRPQAVGTTGMSSNDTPVIWLNVAKRVRTRKAVDEIDQVRCKSGSFGVIREEVYVDAAGAVVKYNLVFIHFGLCQQDNGRVLGYDNAHGHHERHWMGSMEPAGFINYERTLRRFLDEVEALKEKA
jgi:hypothetical protein